MTATYLTTQEVMEHFGVSRPLVRIWRQTGLLTGTYFGHGWKYLKEDVDAFQEATRGYRISSKFHCELTAKRIGRDKHEKNCSNHT